MLCGALASATCNVAVRCGWFDLAIPGRNRHGLLWRHDPPPPADVLRRRAWLLARARDHGGAAVVAES